MRVPVVCRAKMLARSPPPSRSGMVTVVDFACFFPAVLGSARHVRAVGQPSAVQGQAARLLTVLESSGEI